MDESRTRIYEAGKKAYFDGLSRSDNPHERHTGENILWLRGYKDGEQMDIEQDPDGN